jgi:hypothetical protein
MPPRIAGLTKLTLETAPAVCHECIWWQTRGRRTTDKDRWMEKVELDFGAWGTVYYDGDGRVLGSMQYGPPQAFPRAGELPAGPPSEDAMLVTCAYIVETVFPQDFLSDFGFRVLRASGRVGLSRLDLGGLQPVEEGARQKVLQAVRSAFGVPEPAPIPRP